MRESPWRSVAGAAGRVATWPGWLDVLLVASVFAYCPERFLHLGFRARHQQEDLAMLAFPLLLALGMAAPSRARAAAWLRAPQASGAVLVALGASFAAALVFARSRWPSLDVGLWAAAERWDLATPGVQRFDETPIYDVRLLAFHANLGLLVATPRLLALAFIRVWGELGPRIPTWIRAVSALAVTAASVLLLGCWGMLAASAAFLVLAAPVCVLLTIAARMPAERPRCALGLAAWLGLGWCAATNAAFFAFDHGGESCSPPSRWAPVTSLSGPTLHRATTLADALALVAFALLAYVVWSSARRSDSRPSSVRLARGLLVFGFACQLVVVHGGYEARRVPRDLVRMRLPHIVSTRTVHGYPWRRAHVDVALDAGPERGLRFRNPGFLRWIEKPYDSRTLFDGLAAEVLEPYQLHPAHESPNYYVRRHFLGESVVVAAPASMSAHALFERMRDLHARSANSVSTAVLLEAEVRREQPGLTMAPRSSTEAWERPIVILGPANGRRPHPLRCIRVSIEHGRRARARDPHAESAYEDEIGSIAISVREDVTLQEMVDATVGEREILIASIVPRGAPFVWPCAPPPPSTVHPRPWDYRLEDWMTLRAD